MPEHLNELAILVAARFWNSQVEWTIHATEALRAGLSQKIIDAICEMETPFLTREEYEIYEFSRQILTYGDVSDSIYDAVLERWGDVVVVELTAVVGYYSLVAMTLNVHQIPVPKGLTPSLSYKASYNSTNTVRNDEKCSELPLGRLIEEK